MVAAEQQRGVAAPVTAGIAQSRLQYDSARPNDELSLKEIKRLIADTYRRIDAFEMTEESVVVGITAQKKAANAKKWPWLHADWPRAGQRAQDWLLSWSHIR